MNYLLFLLSLIVISSEVSAGVRVGNGGDALVCYTDTTKTKISSLEMFDYWEQRQVNPSAGPIELGDAKISIQDKINLVVNRMGTYDPELAAEIKTIALSIANNLNAFLVSQDQVPEIFDANPKALPQNSNCFITQFAIQWQNTEDGIRRFYISKDLFNHTVVSNDTKAGLILHEAIYRYAIVHGAFNSDGVRFFNFIAATSLIPKNNLTAYVNLLNKSQMNYKKCFEAKDTYVKDVYFYHIENTDSYPNCFQSHLVANYFSIPYKPNELSYSPSNGSIVFNKFSGFIQSIGTKISRFKIDNRFISFNFENTTSEVPELKFNSPFLNHIICASQEIIYDLKLNTVAQCDISTQVVHFPSHQNFEVHKIIYTEDDRIVLNFTTPQLVEMNTRSKSKLLVDIDYPVVFKHDGTLIRAVSVSPLNYNKNGILGTTHLYELVNNSLVFQAQLKMINPLKNSYRITLDDINFPDTDQLCKEKSADLKWSSFERSKEYVTVPEKFYSLKQNKVIQTSDTFIDLLTELECSGEFSVLAKDL